LGKVTEVQGNYVLVQKGIINKEIFYIPKDQAESYDGTVLRFGFSEQELDQYQGEPSSSENIQEQETSPQQETENESEEEENIQLTEERLDVSNNSQEDQATITKKPIKETKTVEVPLQRQEIESIERRPPSDETEAQDPIQSPEEIKIPLKREEPEVTKKPYVKEVVIKKQTKLEDKEISEIRSEELETSNPNEQ